MENKLILIFGTASNIDVLNTCNIWLADGTFKTAPNLFYQFYVIHSLKGGPNSLEDGHLLPCLFILLSNKSEDVHTLMWREIKILCPNACPSHLIVDFQNIWRKIQELGLKARYQQDSTFAFQIKMIPAL